MRRILDHFWGPSDPRTYALVRIGLAFASLYNLLELWPVRYEYFASCGMISLPGLQVTAAGGFYTSIFYWVSSRAGVTVVFLVAAAATLALGAGVFMRTSAVLVWAWNISYSDRVFPILHSWDALLRVYSLLVMVSPLGRIWSVAGLRSPRERDADPVPVYGLRLMRWQLFVVYVTTFWLKAPDEFWRNGQVCAYFSMSFYSRTPNSTWLARHEWVSAVQTYLSLVIEASVPWLLAMKSTRLWGFLAGFALHFAIAMTSILAVFSICLLPGYLAFLDGDDIDRAAGFTRRLARFLPVARRPSPARS